MKHLIFSLIFVVVLSGCAGLGQSLRNMVRGKDDPNPAATKASHLTKFSDNENHRVGQGDRQYKRMNRQKYEEEAELKADAGSLWVMEGQGAYLFAQNQIRIVGDLLNVKIEGAPKQQLQTKVKVISKLLERLEAPVRAPAAQQPQAQAANAQPGTPGQNPPAAGGQNQNNPQGNADGADKQAGASQEKQEPPFAVQVVPTRIVEQMRDGSYRVRGMQPFMIGKREYKVIVTGVIRPEDFDDAGVEASRLLDPQFDIVSSRKGTL